MDWTKITLIPQLKRFDDGVAYAEWLLNHSDIILTPGEVYIIHLLAENFMWIKVGDGCTAFIDLPHIS